MEIVGEASERYEVRIFAESRLGNHYHQVVQTPRANLPSFMRYVNAGFTQYSNYRHQRIGHLFNGPYKPILIDDADYLRVATAYVVMNAVNHGFVDAPEEWKWSSYRATVGLEAPPEYLCLDWLDHAFPAGCRLESQRRFRDYLMVRTWIEGEEWLTKPLAGSTEFERELRERIGATLFMAALPKSYRMINRPPLSELFDPTMEKAQRNTQMLRAHVLYAYSISEIARAMCMHPGTVSRIVASVRRTARNGRGC